MAGGLLHRDLVAEGGEVGVEYAGVEALVIGDVVARVPLIGNAGEKGVEQFLHAGAVAGVQQARQADAVGSLPVPILDQVAQQMFIQALPDLAIGIAEPTPPRTGATPWEGQPRLPVERQSG